jgi:N-acetylglutamate synthase-like GNAT family acetyltransferase
MPEIRVAEYRDAPALVELLAQLGYPTDVRSVERRLEVLLPRTDGALLVAEEGGSVIGLGTLHLLPVLHEDAPRGQITALVVAESARGRGAGQALVHHLEQIARERGVRRMVVTTANHRARTHHFYEQLGYEWTGRRYARALPAAE